MESVRKPVTTTYHDTATDVFVTGRQREAVLHELNAELLRVNRRIQSLVQSYSDMVVLAMGCGQTEPACNLDDEEAGGTLAMIVRDYQAATRENLEAIANARPTTSV